MKFQSGFGFGLLSNSNDTSSIKYGFGFGPGSTEAVQGTWHDKPSNNRKHQHIHTSMRTYILILLFFCTTYIETYRFADLQSHLGIGLNKDVFWNSFGRKKKKKQLLTITLLIIWANYWSILTLLLFTSWDHCLYIYYIWTS